MSKTKENLILEYLDLTLEYMSYASPEPVDKKRKATVVNRLMDIRALLGMETISLR